MGRHDLYGALYREALFPVYDRLIKRRSIHAHYRRISDNPRMPLSGLRDLQRRKLSELLAHCARHGPYYARVCEETGLDVERRSDIDALRERGIFTSK